MGTDRQINSQCHRCSAETLHASDLSGGWNECPRCGHMQDIRRTPGFGEGLLSDRPKVITLCGSTKYMPEFLAETRRLTLDGHIVISVGLFGHTEAGFDWGTDEEPSELKVMLDKLHLDKIDLAEEIHVIDVDGYIGTSTRREMNYAKANGKSITLYSDWVRQQARRREVMES